MFEISNAMYVVQYIYVLGDELKKISSFRSYPIYNVYNYCVCMYLFDK